jgi:hypothetical protein
MNIFNAYALLFQCTCTHLRLCRRVHNPKNTAGTSSARVHSLQTIVGRFGFADDFGDVGCTIDNVSVVEALPRAHALVDDKVDARHDDDKHPGIERINEASHMMRDVLD